MIARGLFLIFCVSMAAAQTANYADIASGKGKLPYGKAVTLTGKMTDLKCGQGPLATFLQNPALAVSYVGQTTPPVSATVSGNDWSAPLGSLPADHIIVLKLNVSGKISPAERAKIINQLLASDEFRRSLDAFFSTSVNQPPSVLKENATRLVRGLTDDQGVITKVLQTDASCLSIADVSKNIAAEFMAHNQAWANPPARLFDLKTQVANFHVQGLAPDASPADAYQFASAHVTGCDQNNQCTENAQSPFTANPPLSADQRIAIRQTAGFYKQDYEALLATFNNDVVATLTADAVMDLSTSTPDLSKYASFDAGAIYIPRIEELRQFFMVHVYPWGPVELDTNGVAAIKDWRSRFSIALGASIGDISANSGSRVKNDKAFVYGVGYRINKYFRVSVGGAVYRDTRTFDLHNEAFIGPSIDITALPGLKQVFASAQSKSNPKN